MSETRYGKPCMANLPYDLGKSIFNDMDKTPKVNIKAMQRKARKMELEMLKKRLKSK